MLDTEAMAWEPLKVDGVLPPPRGNHSAVVVSERLWLFGGDSAHAAALPHPVWSLQLSAHPHSPTAWAAVSATGEPAPPSCDHAAVAIGARVLLLGGSSSEPSGYLPFHRIPIFHTDTLQWSRMTCGGSVPSSRAGHVAAAVPIGAVGGGHSVYIFGGGNSATGFDDLHVLSTSTLRWSCLSSSTAADTPDAQPLATEGAAIAHSGGMLLVFGGYTAAGATRRCYAWGCALAGEAEGPSSVGSHSSSGRVTPALESSGGGEPLPLAASASAAALVLLACPSDSASAQRQAKAAQQAMVGVLEAVHVVPTTAEPTGEAPSAVLSATSQEQALSLVTQARSSHECLPKRPLDDP